MLNTSATKLVQLQGILNINLIKKHLVLSVCVQSEKEIVY